MTEKGVCPPTRLSVASFPTILNSSSQAHLPLIGISNHITILTSQCVAQIGR
ncbi:hypothetical protein [Methanospirillum lacunae]|uniref:hypothetical protein n=1 Tax=Methanospirillum lacunae TaxID=668570 RepID=UPI0015E83543|nr:hypothetical protein [Methanospirillum lacunae]